MVERKKLENLTIDIEKGVFLLNGEDMSGVSNLEINFENGRWTLLVTRDEIYEQAAPEKITKFKVLVSVTDAKKFSELVFDILKDKESAKEIESFLKEEYTKEGLQTLKSIAQGGYPLSLDGLQ